MHKLGQRHLAHHEGGLRDEFKKEVLVEARFSDGPRRTGEQARFGRVRV
ncbi:hypothetical protein [Paraburkholderia terrae]|nr:hypothetical protein [Paraburkholderia terrae]